MNPKTTRKPLGMTPAKERHAARMRARSTSNRKRLAQLLRWAEKRKREAS